MKKEYLNVYECRFRQPISDFPVVRIEADPKNIAAFIVMADYEKDYALYDQDGRFLLTTMGKYADRIPDENLRKDILEYLIPMQMGEEKIPKVRYVLENRKKKEMLRER
ncbi:hypothetical protein [Massilicoli timonensis]|uniref:hypothetical protein n=1 Tax=Massilicoli timonensis TaxID=2015901 RepID=UPI000C82AD93|nr:hypothetical protein [Massilicoli timonensis]